MVLSFAEISVWVNKSTNVQRMWIISVVQRQVAFLDPAHLA